MTKYCGHAADPESERRADAYEIEDLEMQVRSIQARLRALETGRKPPTPQICAQLNHIIPKNGGIAVNTPLRRSRVASVSAP